MSVTLHSIWSESLELTISCINFLKRYGIKIEYDIDPYVSLILSMKNMKCLSEFEQKIVNNRVFIYEMKKSKLDHDEKLTYCLLMTNMIFSVENINIIRNKIIEKHNKEK